MTPVDRFLPAVVLASTLLVAGCAGVSLREIAREEPGGSGHYVRLDVGAGLVQAFRGGRALDPRRGMLLQPGDEIETAPTGAAVLHFADRGEVVVAGGSRVRIGSLEVLFGRIFANVRGLFTVSSENVVAGVEGTRFLFEVNPGRSLRVVVDEGSVLCRSKTQSWPPTRVGRHDALLSRYPNRDLPVVRPASGAEMEEIQQWVRQIMTAASAGYCCDGGRVFRSLSDQCSGTFRSTAEAARKACAALQPGWCCTDGRVTPTTQGRCRGAFFTDSVAAERACAPRPEPRGFCCVNGRVRESTPPQCRGQFFRDPESAQRACTPPPDPAGYCCVGGDVSASTPRECAQQAGRFYRDVATARHACRRTQPPDRDPVR